MHTELKMPIQGPQWTEFLSCEVCYKLFSEKANRPISLGCGHTVCKMCLSRLQQSKCPFDQSPITCDIDKLPVNYALLQLVGAAIPDKLIDKDDSIGDLFDARKAEYYESARKCIEELAVYLKPLSEGKWVDVFLIKTFNFNIILLHDLNLLIHLYHSFGFLAIWLVLILPMPPMGKKTTR